MTRLRPITAIFSLAIALGMLGALRGPAWTQDDVAPEETGSFAPVVEEEEGAAGPPLIPLTLPPVILPGAKPRLAVTANPGPAGKDLPFYESGQPLDDKLLAGKLSASLSRPELEKVRFGLHAIDLSTDEPLVEVGGRTMLNPASNQKVLTTAVALLKLGPEYRFATEIRSLAQPTAEGALKGDLYLVGGGDPWMVVEQVYRLAAELYAVGLRKIEGDLVVDQSFFDDVYQGPGWEQDDSNAAYQAPMGALSVNFNTIAVYVTPAANGQPPAVGVLPLSPYLKIDNTAVTSEHARSAVIVDAPKDGDKNKLVVTGTIHPKSGRRIFFVKIDNPPLFAGWAIHDALKKVGIEVKGKVVVRKAPESSEVLYKFLSPPLATLISLVNKYSNNHMAEQILKTVGAETRGAPGTWDKGLQTMHEVIEQELAFPANGYVLKNGSGLGDVNQIPPELLTRMLSRMYHDPQVGPEYMTSMAVAGRDGTLRSNYRDEALRGKLRAKTGTLEQVIALSGYLLTRSGRMLAVSLVFNDCLGKDRWRLRRIQEEVFALLADWDPGDLPAEGRKKKE
ncbi:MAG: D-alanyl-D-alanine carboxypeptidase/D-alanyl-D-alanine-endopeptidase [Myxococcales bacterium]|nr:MAG: D-alanyl-D-alanine carboxypeptidase/D-alanyl-D-alanine-endopeptidase [Myxococcales bacterium]